MSREYKSPTRDAILAHLRENDNEPITPAQLAQKLGKHLKAIEAAVRLMRSVTGGKTNLLYITGYKRCEGKGMWAPLLAEVPAEGDPPADAKKPKAYTFKQRQDRYRDKNRALLRARDRQRRPKTPKTEAQLMASNWLAVLGVTSVRV
jgi:hypothetical protein